jgi:hypothetical protein
MGDGMMRKPNWIKGLLSVMAVAGYVALLGAGGCPFGGDDDDSTDTSGDTGNDTGAADTRIAVDCCQIPEGADCTKAKNDGTDCCVGGGACGPQGRCSKPEGGACTSDVGCHDKLKCVSGTCVPSFCQTPVLGACNPDAKADNTKTGECCPAQAICTGEPGTSPTCRLPAGGNCQNATGNFQDRDRACAPGLTCGAERGCWDQNEPANQAAGSIVTAFGEAGVDSVTVGGYPFIRGRVGDPCVGDQTCNPGLSCGLAVTRTAGVTTIPVCVGGLGAPCGPAAGSYPLDLRGDDSPQCGSQFYCVLPSRASRVPKCAFVDEAVNPPMAYFNLERTGGVPYALPQVYGPKLTPWGDPEPENNDPLPQFGNTGAAMTNLPTVTVLPAPKTEAASFLQARTTSRMTGVAPREMPGTKLDLQTFGPKATPGSTTFPKVNCPPADPQFKTYTQQCGTKCIEALGVCCPGGEDFCAAGATCVTGKDPQGNDIPACYDSTQPAACDAGQTQCGIGCMPAGAECCDDNKSFCRDGKTCQPGGGCCPKEGCAKTCLDGWVACGAGCMPEGSKCCSNGGYCFNPPYECSADGTRCVLDAKWAEQWVLDQIEKGITTTPQVVKNENCVNDPSSIGSNELCSSLTVDTTNNALKISCDTTIKIPDGTTISCATNSCEPSNTAMQCCGLKAVDQYLNDPTTPKAIKDRLRTERAKYKLSTEK